jgi:hypothetical protein
MDGGKDGWIEAEGDSQGPKPRCLAELEKTQSSRAESVGGLAATEGRKRARPARQRGWWARTQFWLQFWLRANAWPRGSLDCARARARARALAIWVLLWRASTAKARPGLREWVAWAHASPRLCPLEQLRCCLATARASSYARATVVLQPAYNPLFCSTIPDRASTPHRLTLFPLSLFSLPWILCTPFRNPHQPSHCPKFGLNAKSTQLAHCTVPSYSTP